MIAVEIKSKKFGNKFCFIDGEDFDKIKNYKWHLDNIRNTNNFYAVSKPTVNGKVLTIRMHRLISCAPDNYLVDHRDHNGLNNTKENLRICNRNQNQMNSLKRKCGITSKHKGVSLHKMSNKYRATIVSKRKQIYLGLFESEDDAGLAYNIKAIELFGEFAYLNKIEVNNVTEY